MTNPLAFQITGSPIGTDNDPNSVAPSAARTWLSPPHVRAADDASAIEFELKDGTSLTGQLWILLDTGVWGKLGAAITLAIGTVSSPISVVGGGASLFFQVTANPGSSTVLYAGFSNPASGSGVIATKPPASASISTPAQVSVSTAAALPTTTVVNYVDVQADIANTANVRIGDGNVTTTRGTQLAPGDSKRFYVPNSNLLTAVSESGTQKLNLEYG